MLERHHVSLSIFTIVLLYVPYYQHDTNLKLIMCILIGVTIGSSIPDVDSPNPGYLTKFLIYRPVLFFGRTLLKKYNISEKHRGFMHSFIGVSTAALFTAVYLLIILILLDRFNFWYFSSFIFGYIFGSLFHLIQDSATVAGIQFNYPFSNLTLKGRLRTRIGATREADIFTYFLLVSIFILSFIIYGLEFILRNNWITSILDKLHILVLMEFFLRNNWMTFHITVIFIMISWYIFLSFVAKVRWERG
ncbi:MAG: metal-dependent hydrolase [Candidatus Methanofastidiosia archaeon]